MRSIRSTLAMLILPLAIALLLAACSRDPEISKRKYFAAGQNYMKKGQYGDAVIEFRNSLRLDPRFVDAYYQLARADLAQHDWSAAFASLEKAIELDPSRADARLDRGRLYLAARQFDRAEDEGRFILKENPRDVGAYQLLGATFIGEQKPEQALTQFSKVTELLPNSTNAYVNMALVEVSLNRPDDAEQHLKKALAVGPKETQVYVDLANLYRLENRIPESQLMLQTGLQRIPDGIQLYLGLASLEIGQGQKDQAEALLDTLRNRLPKSPEAAIAIGDFYLQKEGADRALAEYRRGLSIAPDNLNIQKRLLDLYLSSGQTRPAADLDRQLVKEAPKDVVVRIDHGRLLMAQGKTLEAITNLQKAATDAADSPLAHYFLGMAYWQNGELGQANSSLLDALRVAPGLPIVVQGLARLSLVAGHPSNAQIYAQEMVQKFPSDPADRQILSEALARQGQFQPAEGQILIARQLVPSDSTVRLNLAQIYSAEKKWPEAEKEFEAAFELAPHNTAILEQWADLLIARNQSADALTHIQQYVAANQNDINGHIVLGALSSRLNNSGLAHAELQRAIQIDPRNVRAHLEMAKLYQAEGQIDLAIADYQRALELQPNLAPLATMIGDLYLQKNDDNTALSYYRRALFADPNSAAASANTAWIDAQQGKNLDMALEMAQKAKAELPDVPSITDTLAWVLYKRGNYASAIPLLQECVQKEPDSAPFHYHFGMTLLANGQKNRGRDQLETALRMKLGKDEAQEAQRMLEQFN